MQLEGWLLVGPRSLMMVNGKTESLPVQNKFNLIKMLKALLFLAIAGILTLMFGALIVSFHAESRITHAQASRKSTQEIDEILESLTISLPKASATNTREKLNYDLKKRENAIVKLRANPSLFLPQIMEKISALSLIERTNQNVAADKTAQLTAAFEVLGESARPLLPMLKREFDSGKNIGVCVAAFQYIGGTDSGFMVVSGLTNSSRLVRNASMSVLASFANNSEVAGSAVKPLLEILKNDSAFSRALAANVLGSLHLKPNIVVASLLKVAVNDSDLVVKVSAIKAIGRFGTNAVAVKPELEYILEKNRDDTVKRIISETIRRLNGEKIELHTPTIEETVPTK